VEQVALRPNIVFIMADDLGYESLGCDGGLDYATPHLDALAAGGVRFEHAHSTPVCTPTRVQVMTGRYTQRNYDCFGYLRSSESTFANLLRDAGYDTCIAGKWQLSGDAESVRDLGFDRHCLWNMKPYRVEEDGRQAHQPESWGRRYHQPTLYRNGEWTEYDADHYGPRVCLDFIREFIAEERDAPFLVYYPMILTHGPFVPTPASDDPHCDDRQANFADMVQYADWIVGELVSALEEHGLRERTLVLFTADNGTHVSLRTRTATGVVKGGKASTRDAGTHVPFIANWPGRVTSGRVSPALVDFTDLLPTFAELAGVELPGERVLDGHSLWSELSGRGPHPREWIFCYYPARGRDFDDVSVFARDQRWKLYDDGRLFDVVADPSEQEPGSEEREGSAGESDAREARRRLSGVLEEMGAR